MSCRKLMPVLALVAGLLNACSPGSSPQLIGSYPRSGAPPADVRRRRRPGRCDAPCGARCEPLVAMN